MLKHCQKEHDGVKQNFYMETLKSFSSRLKRQFNEGVRLRITTGKERVVININSEFQQAPISRITVTTGLELDQGEDMVWGSRGRGSGQGKGSGQGRGRVEGRGGGQLRGGGQGEGGGRGGWRLGREVEDRKERGAPGS